jgi:hypothetical protein
MSVTADVSQPGIEPYGVPGQMPPTGSTARHAATAVPMLASVRAVWARTDPQSANVVSSQHALVVASLREHRSSRRLRPPGPRERCAAPLRPPPLVVCSVRT